MYKNVVTYDEILLNCPGVFSLESGSVVRNVSSKQNLDELSASQFGQVTLVKFLI